MNIAVVGTRQRRRGLAARTLEDGLGLLRAISNAAGGQAFYRFGAPGAL